MLTKAPIRRLGPGDERALERFLAMHPESSMFLRANLRQAGIEDNGQPFEATYVAAIADDAIVGVAAQCWNGMVLVQAPDGHAGALAIAAVAATKRKIWGLSGPWDQVVEIRQQLGLAGAATTIASREDLFSLALADLAVPEALMSGACAVRPPRKAELGRLVNWRAAYRAETMGEAIGPVLRERAGSDIERWDELGAHFVLVAAGQMVAYAAFNAALPDMVQIGGVWTPPELRGRGHGRCVVAGALLAARETGVERATLFASDAAAQNVYRSLGFARIGDYGLVIFSDV